MSERTEGAATPRRKLFHVLLCALPVLILGSSLAAWYVSQPRPRRAVVLLKISREVPSILGDGRTEDWQYRQYIETQKAMLRSRFVLDAAVKDPDIHRLETIRRLTDPAGWLEQSLEIRQVDGSELLEISLAAEPYGDAARIVNAVADVYLREVVDLEREQRDLRLQELKRIGDGYAKRASESRSTLANLRKALEPKGEEGINSSSIDLADIEQSVEIEARISREALEAAERLAVELSAPSRIQRLKRADPLKDAPVAAR